METRVHLRLNAENGMRWTTKLTLLTAASSLAMCVTDVSAQWDLSKGLRDLQKAVDPPRTSVTAPDHGRGGDPRESAAKDAPTDRELCLDDMCIGDDITVLMAKSWIPLASWMKADATLERELRGTLNEAVGKRRTDQMFKEQSAQEKRDGAGARDERLVRAFGGRVIADEPTLAGLAKYVSDRSLQPFDADVLATLSKVQAVCRMNPNDSSKPQFVGVLAKDSPNKTAFLLDLVPEPSGEQRWTVTAIARVFAVQSRDKPAMDELQRQLMEQFPSVRRGQTDHVDTERFTGFVLADHPRFMTRFGETAAVFLRNSVHTSGNEYAQLIVMSDGYNGMGRRKLKGPSTSPPQCASRIRTD
jgi:hypothetical protein